MDLAAEREIEIQRLKAVVLNHEDEMAKLKHGLVSRCVESLDCAVGTLEARTPTTDLKEKDVTIGVKAIRQELLDLIKE